VTPVEPPPTPWVLPDPASAGAGVELLGVGADLAPGTLLAAYRSGLFPMPVDADGPLGWWSPDPRGVIPLDGLRVSASLRRSCRRYVTTVDTAFVDVVRACGDPRRSGGWITPGIVEAYAELHRLGWAHSVETRTAEGDLVGGLYGVEIGGLFAGESMFSAATDASKVALVALVERLVAAGAAVAADAGAPAGAGAAVAAEAGAAAGGGAAAGAAVAPGAAAAPAVAAGAAVAAAPGAAVAATAAADTGRRLLDVQWRTEHLATLGAVEVSRPHYLRLLHHALPLPAAF
jgi:leucyl/phenylalanyl-tRNA--protein transferase